MKKIIPFQLITVCILLFSTGCKKGTTAPTSAIVVPLPAITSITPVSGSAGTSVTITGSNFDVASANNTVKFNGVAATVKSATSTTLVVTAPATGTTGNITIATAAGVSNGITFTYQTGPDIYVAGTNVLGVEGYWKNSVFTGVSDCKTAYSITGSGNDIYLAGPGSSNTPTYWKNGTAVQLDSKTGNTRGVFVSGSDVYTTGIVGSSLEYWKNGTANPLTAPSSGNVASIFVSGNDVYVAGYQIAGGGYYWQACYWKNGAPVNLTAAAVSNAVVNSVFVSGNDVYAVGYEEQKVGTGIINIIPRCWKNGPNVQELSIPGYSLFNNAFCVLTVGTDVYVGGQYNGAGAVWKNGTMINVAGYAVAEKVTSMILYNNDLYVTGSSSSSGLNGYWINGVFTQMSPGCGAAGPGCAGTSGIAATGIYVK